MSSITELLYTQNENYDAQKTPGFVQGVVVENNNSEFKGMVKVEFTVWEQGKNMCEWVRLLTNYTGASYGNYIVPEIDEVVLVGFIGGSLKRPFLLGSLYPADASVISDNFNDTNYIKSFKTKAGTSIVINDESGKESLTVTTPKGSMIVIEDENETCTISDKSAKNGVTFDFKKGEVDLFADKKITLAAGSVKIAMDGSSNSCTISAKDIDVNATNNVTIKGTNNATLQGTNKAEVKGATASLSGDMKAEISGSLQTTVKGGLVQIN